MQTTKRAIYNKISKFFPFDSPFYLFPNNQLLQDALIYEDTCLTPEADAHTANLAMDIISSVEEANKDSGSSKV